MPSPSAGWPRPATSAVGSRFSGRHSSIRRCGGLLLLAAGVSHDRDQASICRSSGVRPELLGRHLSLYAHRNRLARRQGQRPGFHQGPARPGAIDPAAYPGIEVNVPTMAVIATDCFHDFIERNHLSDLHFDELSDDHIGHAFQQADLPVELLGDLRALSEQVKTPLAIRSSSLLEDALDRPFAGVYATKMIPNNQLDADTRFRQLIEAIKFVYASTYFREARDYIRTTGCDPRGREDGGHHPGDRGPRHDDRFYPDLSGVGRSYNFYSSPPATPEDGVVNLALGLGKTIVDGGIVVDVLARLSAQAAAVRLGRTRCFAARRRSSGPSTWASRPPTIPSAKRSTWCARTSKMPRQTKLCALLLQPSIPARNRVIPGTGARGGRDSRFRSTAGAGAVSSEQHCARRFCRRPNERCRPRSKSNSLPRWNSRRRSPRSFASASCRFAPWRCRRRW